MPTPFPQQQITASLLTWFRDQYPLTTTIAYPNVRIDTTTLDDWLELSLAQWSRRPQRSSSLKQISLSLTIHCFAKQKLDKSRIHQLTDAVRQTISQKTVPLRDYDTSGTPVIGYATLHEPEIRDLTRPDTDTQRHHLQHTVITTPGTAQQI